MNQISKDSLDRHKLAFFRSGLAPCTHSYTQHDIGSGCAKVKERVDHGSVYLLVHVFTLWIKLKMTFSLHWSSNSIEIRHLEPLEHVLDVFFLINKGSLSKLLDLESKKEP